MFGKHGNYDSAHRMQEKSYEPHAKLSIIQRIEYKSYWLKVKVK